MNKELLELYLAKRHLRAAEYVVDTFKNVNVDLPSSADAELTSLREDYEQALKNYVNKYNSYSDTI